MQALSSRSAVGIEIVRGVYGVSQHERAAMGVVATTSYFTASALEFQKNVKHQLSLKKFSDVVGWLERYFDGKE